MSLLEILKSRIPGDRWVILLIFLPFILFGLIEIFSQPLKGVFLLGFFPISENFWVVWFPPSPLGGLIVLLLLPIISSPFIASATIRLRSRVSVRESLRVGIFLSLPIILLTILLILGGVLLTFILTLTLQRLVAGIALRVVVSIVFLLILSKLIMYPFACAERNVYLGGLSHSWELTSLGWIESIGLVGGIYVISLLISQLPWGYIFSIFLASPLLFLLSLGLYEALNERMGGESLISMIRSTMERIKKDMERVPSDVREGYARELELIENEIGGIGAENISELRNMLDRVRSLEVEVGGLVRREMKMRREFRRSLEYLWRSVVMMNYEPGFILIFLIFTIPFFIADLAIAALVPEDPWMILLAAIVAISLIYPAAIGATVIKAAEYERGGMHYRHALKLGRKNAARLIIPTFITLAISTVLGIVDFYLYYPPFYFFLEDPWIANLAGMIAFLIIVPRLLFYPQLCVLREHGMNSLRESWRMSRGVTSVHFITFILFIAGTIISQIPWIGRYLTMVALSPIFLISVTLLYAHISGEGKVS